MSFICDRCHVQQPHGSKPTRVADVHRVKEYPPRYREGILIDEGGIGDEVVREQDLCSKCAMRAKSKFKLPT